MSQKLGPITWRNFVKKLKALGYSGPEFGGKHAYMTKGDKTQTIPNQHDGDIGVGLLRRLLKQLDVSVSDWNDL